MYSMSLTDSEYERIQDEDNSWNYNSVYGEHACESAETYYNMIKNIHEPGDTFADFGGNDGTAANWWLNNTDCGTAYSIDMSKDRQEWGRGAYPRVTFINSRIESIDLPDDSVRWGFCSHTLEHLKDFKAGLGEIHRIITTALYVVIPLEVGKSGSSHMRMSPSPLDWLNSMANDKLPTYMWHKPFTLPEIHVFYMSRSFADTVVKLARARRGTK